MQSGSWWCGHLISSHWPFDQETWCAIVIRCRRQCSFLYLYRHESYLLTPWHFWRPWRRVCHNTDVLIEDTDAQPSTARLSDIALNVSLSQCLGSQKEAREYLRSHREPIKTRWGILNTKYECFSVVNCYNMLPSPFSSLRPQFQPLLIRVLWSLSMPQLSLLLFLLHMRYLLHLRQVLAPLLPTCCPIDYPE